jgi:hypothetical protein
MARGTPPPAAIVSPLMAMEAGEHRNVCRSRVSPRGVLQRAIVPHLGGR